MAEVTLNTPMDDKEFALLFDHTALKADVVEEDIVKLCTQAANAHFMSVCVNPCWVSKCKELLANSNVKVCTVIGFPLGANATDVKAFETEKSILDGAMEVDMVLNVGQMKADNLQYVEDDIRAVVHASKATNSNVIVKIILETCLLTSDEIKTACKIAVKAGVDFVKTSTGFSTSGAKVEDVKLMRETVGKDVGVKASGGIRDYATAIAMVNAGANRLGCSAGAAIIAERATGGGVVAANSADTTGSLY